MYGSGSAALSAWMPTLNARALPLVGDILSRAVSSATPMRSEARVTGHSVPRCQIASLFLSDVLLPCYIHVNSRSQ